MSRCLFAATLTAVAVLFGPATARFVNTAAGADNQAPPSGKAASATEEASIKELGEAYARAFNAGDGTALANLWAADSEYIAEDGTATKGKAALADRFNKLFAEQKGLKMSIAMKSIRQIASDVAMSDGTVEITRPDGDKDSTRFHAVAVRKDGHWLLHTVRDLSDEAEQALSTGHRTLKSLEWLVGHWTAGTKEAPIVLSCHWDRNQSFLLQEYALKEADGELFTVSQRIGYDPLTDQLKSWTFDSRGGYGEGYWTREGNAWVVESAGVLSSGGQGTSRNVWRFVDEDHFDWEARDREVDDVPVPDVTVKFTRKPQATASVQPK